MTVKSPESQEWVQLVDERGCLVGGASKLDAHVGSGLLHRAVSVLVFWADGRLILQRRADSKYHFAGQWANSCCSHPLGEESPMEGATRALRNELGLHVNLEEQFTFTYQARDPLSQLIEREFDHVFVGLTEESPATNAEHVSDWRLVSAEELALEMRNNPGEFVPWLEEILREASHREVPSLLLSRFSRNWESAR